MQNLQHSHALAGLVVQSAQGLWRTVPNLSVIDESPARHIAENHFGLGFCGDGHLHQGGGRPCAARGNGIFSLVVRGAGNPDLAGLAA